MRLKNNITSTTHNPDNSPLEHEIACALCGAAHYDNVLNHKLGAHLTRKLLCHGCGLIYTAPLPPPAELKKINAKRNAGTKPSLKQTYRSAIRALPRFNRVRNLLKSHDDWHVVDVGARTGEFVYLLHNKGYNAYGIESNREYIKHAAREYNLHLEPQYIDELELPSNAAELITCYHVLHLSSDPLTLLRKLYDALKPGGYLNLEVPNIEAKHRPTQQKLKAKNLHMFNVHTLLGLVKLAGFTLKNTILIPGTLHINIIAHKERNVLDIPMCNQSGLRNTKNYLLVRDMVIGYRSFDYLITSAPYCKLLGKIQRQFREVKNLWSYSSAKQVVNTLFNRK